MPMDAKQKQSTPKLTRRNAIKNIDYDAATTTSSSSSSPRSPYSSPPFSSANTRTRSLDLSPLSDNGTSFRIIGIDGEFELFCRNLGFSGPEDFAIPTAVWEARKGRSVSDGLLKEFNFSPPEVDVVDKVRSDAVSGQFEAKVRDGSDVKQEIESSKLKNGLNLGNFGSRGVRVSDEGCVGTSNGEIKQVIESSDRGVRVSDEGSVGASNGEIEGSEWKNGLDLGNFGRGGVRVSSDEGSVGPRNSSIKHENEYLVTDIGRKQDKLVGVGPSKKGIKGERPPVLAPPPVKLSPVVDNVSSTWDILKSFAPQEDDEDLVSPVQVGFVSRLGENDRVTEKNEVVDGGIVDTSDDDDDDGGADVLSVIMEPVYSISPNGIFRLTITSWQKGELLGSGSFGTVYEGFTDDGFFFAVKEVSLLDQGSQGKQSIFQLEQEISLLSQFEHENIVRYLGTDKDDAKLYIFLELVTKGSLASLYRKYNLRDSQVSAYTRQILSGLKYLHERNVVHRDIKCANILVDVSGSVKLADFGLAKATKMNDVRSSKGTPFWMAPEVVNLRNRGYGLAADIWSLGCTVLEMLTRQPPYSHLEGMQALFRIGKGEPPPIPNSLSTDARDFILKCIQVNPNNRPTAAQLLEHPFVKRPLSTSAGLPSPHYHSVRS